VDIKTKYGWQELYATAVLDVGSGNSEPLFPEILTRSDFAGKASSKSR
jgi:hypothetical protein